MLMKNEHSALPLPAGEVLNFFGRGLMEYRICAVGAGKILPRYAVGLLEAWDVIRPNWPAYILITLISTFVVLFISGRVTQAVIRRVKAKEGRYE